MNALWKPDDRREATDSGHFRSRAWIVSWRQHVVDANVADAANAHVANANAVDVTDDDATSRAADKVVHHLGRGAGCDVRLRVADRPE
ncbi:hypothetical protein [Streptomyces sp. NPDC056480]|uniref:hypothetical protein n=1 Tax=Streptomyces sp. NPDC056480 TaxID=3345833 RepID=UPI0036B1053C